MADDNDLQARVNEYRAEMERFRAEQEESNKLLKEMSDNQKKSAAAQEQAATEADINAAVAALREGDMKAVPESLARAWLGVWSEQKTDVADAFANRKQNPDAWRNTLEEGKKVFAEQLKLIGGQETEADDVGEAAEEVSGVSEKVDTRKPKSEDISKLVELSGDEQEWDKFLKAKLASVGG